MTPHQNTLTFTDAELKALNDMARQSKVTATAEELLLIKLGRSSSPLLDAVWTIAVAWETRFNEIQNPPKPDAPPTETIGDVDIEDTD